METPFETQLGTVFDPAFPGLDAERLKLESEPTGIAPYPWTEEFAVRQIFMAQRYFELMPDGPHKGGGGDHGKKSPGAVIPKGGPPAKTPKTRPEPPRNPDKKPR